MKILIVMKGYFPAIHYGGPPVSISNFCKLLNDEFDFFIVASDHEKGSEKRFNNISESWNNRSEAKVKYLPENEMNYRRFKSIVDEVNPDIIYINSLFNAQSTVPLLALCKKKAIPCLIASRGELIKNALQTKRYKKLPYIYLLRKFLITPKTYFQSTSKEEFIQTKKQMRIQSSQIFSLDNIPTLPTERLNNSSKESNKLKCIFLSRIHPQKNLLFAIQALHGLRGEVIYDIYGYIEDQSYWQKVLNEISKLPPNIKVNYCGEVQREDIHKTFAKYHIFILPTLSENYGQAIVESMLSNCPVLISDQTPWTDINNTNAGWAIPLNKKELFKEVLQNLVDMDSLEYKELVFRNESYIKEKLKINELKQNYINALKKIKKGKNNYENRSKE